MIKRSRGWPMLYCHNSSRGMALLVVLAFLAISSMLGLILLQMNVAKSQLVKLRWQQLQLTSIGELALVQIEKSVDPLACHVSRGIKLQQQALAWWQQQCSGNLANFGYHYVTELLQISVCPGGKHTQAFHRITLFIGDENERVLLQSIVAFSTGKDCRKGRQKYWVL